MNCANCSLPALYVYAPPNLVPTPYCDTHLPSFLRAQARAGVLPTTEAFSKARTAALAALAPAPVSEVTEEPEEAAVEEPAPVPAPKKRRPRKPAAEEPVEEA